MSFGFVGIMLSGAIPMTPLSSEALTVSILLLVLTGVLGVGLVTGLLGGVCAAVAIVARGERSMWLLLPVAQALTVVYLVRGDVRSLFGL